MELTTEQIKGSLANYQKVAILPDEKSSDYYEGFYDGIQAILKIIKGA